MLQARVAGSEVDASILGRETMQTRTSARRVLILVAALGATVAGALSGCASSSGETVTADSGASDGAAEGSQMDGTQSDSSNGADAGGVSTVDAGGSAGEAGMDAEGSTGDSAVVSVDAGGSTADSAVASLEDGGADTGASTPSVTKDSEDLLTDAGVTIISYGGYLNGESFQEDGIVSFQGYQYAAFWNTSRHVVLARRLLPSGAWSELELTDYTNTEGDAHNTISLGVSPGDGTLHLSFDQHDSNLEYRKSITGLLTQPSAATWTASSFSAVTSSLVGNTALTARACTCLGAGGRRPTPARITTSSTCTATTTGAPG